MAAGTGVDSTMAVLASTLNAFVQKNIAPTVFDEVLKHNPVLYRFWRKGPTLDGGAALTWPILTASKVKGGWYTGAQQLPHGVEDTMAPAEVLWRHVAEDVTLPRTDLLKARTPYAKVDLVKTKFDEALLNVRARISQALYATAAEGNSLDHLFQAVDDATNYATYAGVSHSLAYWKPGINGDGLMNGPANGGAAALTTLAQVETLYGKACDGDEQPTLLITTQGGFDFIWGQMQALQRFTRDEEMTKAGFEALKFNRAVVVVDRNVPTGNGHILLLNEKWVDLVSHEEENFAIDPVLPGTPSERSINTKVAWSGNVRCKIIRYQAHMQAITNA
jgi:hypothetical protein